MATKKDLVEAYSFSRRRLVTAFVSGAPGGREVEPSRPGRTLIGGVAIAVLVAAGGAIGGILGNHTSVDWSQQALVSDKDTGALYVNLPSQGEDDAKLMPVANVTSAMLLLGPDLNHIEVTRSAIAERTPGPLVGILQAPTAPPDPSDLVENGWSACTSEPGGKARGIQVDVDTAEDTTAEPGSLAVVRVGAAKYLIGEDAEPGGTGHAYAYPLPAQKTDAVVENVTGTAASDTPPTARVDPAWLALLPQGEPLAASSFGGRAFALTLGKPFPEASRVPGLAGKNANVGDYFTASESTFVLTKAGAVRLTAFEAAVYKSTDFGRYTPKPLGNDISTAGIASTALLVSDASHWPAEIGSPVAGGGVCVVLDTDGTGQPWSHLAVAQGSPASAAQVPPGAVEQYVEPGHGALVTSVGTSSGTTDPSRAQRVLIDDRGYHYPLDPGNTEDGQDAVTQLGYASVRADYVPDPWVKLFRDGVPLSVDAARCPPTADSPPTGTAKRPPSCGS